MPVKEQSSHSLEQKCAHRCRKNLPQWNALGSASLIFISGGMSIAWGAGFAVHSPHVQQLTLHMQVSWFAAAFVGCMLGALLTHRMPHRPIYILGSLLVLACGLLFLAWPTRSATIVAARYLDGLANGLVFVPALSTAGEMSLPQLRGLLCCTLEQLSFNLGILLQLLYTACWRHEWNETFVADQVHGVLSIVYGLTALGLALTLCIESPVYLLLHHGEQSAIEALRHLQCPHMVTSETFLQLDELKRYAAANRMHSCWQQLQNSLAPLLKLCLQRALNALSLTFMVWSALRLTSSELTQHYHTWPFVLFGCLRCGGCLCVVFLMDSKGRKPPTLIGALVGGAFAIAFATFAYHNLHVAAKSQLIAALIMLCCFQYFAGLAHTSCSVYLTEAFPLALKPCLVAFVYAVELLTRLSFCSSMPTQTGIATYFFILGGLSLIFCLLGIFCLPETKLTTLNEAQSHFRRWFNNKFTYQQ